jgi:hypothetical protein
MTPKLMEQASGLVIRVDSLEVAASRKEWKSYSMAIAIVDSRQLRGDAVPDIRLGLYEPSSSSTITLCIIFLISLGTKTKHICC